MTKSRVLFGAAALCAYAGTAAAGGGSDYNTDICDVGGDGPDVTLCQVYGLYQASRDNANDMSGLSVGTTSWNVGTERLLWFNSPSPDHPFITFNVYRLMDNQLDQVAQGWVKHGFFALSSSQCFDATVGGCQSTNGDWLGIGCTDTYSPGLNASKSGLAPRFEINPWTGGWSYQGSVFQTGGAPTSGISRHMQVRDEDLDPSLNPGAQYFFEALYICKDDICVYNSAGWKEMTPIATGSGWNFSQSSQNTQPQMNYLVLDARPGSMITEFAEEIPVIEFESPDGRAVVSTHVEDLGNGQWQYNYSVQNVDMNRQIDEFRVPLPAGASLSDDRFHAVFHHDEPKAYINGPSITNDPWTMSREGDEIVWSTPDNPIRWGTMYSFGFVTDVAPVEGTADLGMFTVRSTDPEYVSGTTLVPELGPDCIGDVNNDESVDLADLNLVLANFGTATAEGDADGNGEVDLADLNLVLANFGNNCF